MPMPLYIMETHWDSRLLQNTTKLLKEGWYETFVYLLISELLDGLGADIGSSFTSGFFLYCPLMCLMCCSFYFQKLKLKADSRSLILFTTGYCTKCPLSYQNIRTENVHLESWLSVYMFQSSLMADNLTRPRMKYFWAKFDRAQTCCESHSVLWTHQQPAVVDTAIFEVLLAFYAFSWYSTCNARSHARVITLYLKLWTCAPVQMGILVPWYILHQTMRLHPECQIIKRRLITKKKDSGSSILCNSFKHKIAFVHCGSDNTQE